MVYCTVCMNNNRKNKTISYFCYPKDSTKRQQWLKAVGREDLILKLCDDKTIEQYRICEEHFEKFFIKFSKKRTRKYLFDNALPTLNLPTNDEGSSSSSQCGIASIRENIQFILSTDIPSSSNNPYNEIVMLEDQTSRSIRAHPDTCESSSAQTALHHAADALPKRKLSLELPQAKASSVTPPSSAQSQNTQTPVEDNIKRRKEGATSGDEEEDCAVFCKNLRLQMRDLDTEQNYICQKLISDAVFLARTGQLNLTSCIQTRPMVSFAPPPSVGYNRAPSDPLADSSRGFHYVYTHSTPTCARLPSSSHNDPDPTNFTDDEVKFKAENDFKTSS